MSDCPSCNPRTGHVCVFCQDNREVVLHYGQTACLQLTTNGAIWMMPCTKPAHHADYCEWDHERKIRDFRNAIERMTKRCET